MKLEELRPPKSFVLIEQEVFYLTPFSLNNMINLGAAYSRGAPPSEVANQVIDEAHQSMENLYKLIYYFLEDKDTYPTYHHFKKAITPVKPRFLLNALQENIANSQPIYTKEDRENIELENKRIELTGGATENNWAKFFVLYATEIPITIDQFYDLTMRQIFAVLKEIANKKRPVKESSFTPNPSRIPEETQNQLDELAKQDLEQWQSNQKKNC
jgi:hypothetical protein